MAGEQLTNQQLQKMMGSGTQQQSDKQQEKSETVKTRILYRDEQTGELHQVVFMTLDRKNNTQILREGGSDKKKITKPVGSSRYSTSEEALVMDELNRVRNLGMPTGKDHLVDPYSENSPCPESRVAKLCEDIDQDGNPVSVYSWDWGRINSRDRDEMLEKLQNTGEDEVVVDQPIAKYEGGEEQPVNGQPRFFPGNKVKKELNNKPIKDIYQNKHTQNSLFQQVTNNAKQFGLNPTQKKVKYTQVQRPKDEKDENGKVIQQEPKIEDSWSDNVKGKDEFINESPAKIKKIAYDKIDKLINIMGRNLDSARKNPNALKRLRASMRAAFESIDHMSEAVDVARSKHTEKAIKDKLSSFLHESQSSAGHNYSENAFEPYIGTKDKGKGGQTSEADENLTANRLERENTPYTNDDLQDYDTTHLDRLPEGEFPRYYRTKDTAYKAYKAAKKGGSILTSLPLGILEGVGSGIGSVLNFFGARNFTNKRTSNWNSMINWGPFKNSKPSWDSDPEKSGSISDSKNIQHNISGKAYEDTSTMSADEYRHHMRQNYSNVLEAIRNGPTYDTESPVKRSWLNSLHKNWRNTEDTPFSGFSSIDKVIKHYKKDPNFLESEGRKQRYCSGLSDYILRYEGYPPKSIQLNEVNLPQDVEDQVDAIYQTLYDQDEGSAEGGVDGIETEHNIVNSFNYNIHKGNIETIKNSYGVDEREAIRKELQLQYRNQVWEVEQDYASRRSQWIKKAADKMHQAQNRGEINFQVDYLGVDALENNKLKHKNLRLSTYPMADQGEEELKESLGNYFDAQLKDEVAQSSQILGDLRNKTAEKDFKPGENIKDQYVARGDELHDHLKVAEEDFICREAIQDEFDNVKQHKNFAGFDQAPSDDALFMRPYNRSDMASPSDKPIFKKFYNELFEKAAHDPECKQGLEVLVGGEEEPGLDEYKKQFAEAQRKLVENKHYTSNVVGQHLFELRKRMNEEAEGVNANASFKLFKGNDPEALGKRQMEVELADEFIGQVLANNPQMAWQIMSIFMDIIMSLLVGSSRMERENSNISAVNRAQMFSNMFASFDKMVTNDMMKCLTRDENGSVYVDLEILNSKASSTESYKLANQDRIDRSNEVSRNACYISIAGMALSMGLEIKHSKKAENDEQLQEGAKAMQDYYDEEKPWNLKKALEKHQEDNATEEKGHNNSGELHTDDPEKNPAPAPALKSTSDSVGWGIGDKAAEEPEGSSDTFKPR